MINIFANYLISTIKPLHPYLRGKGYAPFIGVDRHRISTDGEGVTTLVAFYSCPLRCKYCLNPQSLRLSGIFIWDSPNSLLQKVLKDNIYFKSSKGGITFGGGEPLLYPKFISEFKQICPKEWKINVETSLNVSKSSLVHLLGIVDRFIIDIKDMNPITYKQYTGHDNTKVIDNLQFLVQQGLADSMLVRVPLIPGYNTEEDITKSLLTLSKIGIKKTERLIYTTKKLDRKDIDEQTLFQYGQCKCKYLKSIRIEAAKQYNIEYAPHKCNNTKPCSGTCPSCEAELKYINESIDRKYGTYKLA